MSDERLATLKAAAPRVMASLAWLECGPGWDALLLDLACKLEALPAPPAAAQIKEKFGGLRFYLDGYTPEAEALVAAAEELSLRTCETCGEPGERAGTSWLRTRCGECRGKEKR